MLMHIISIHHFWLCPIVWFTQFSIFVSLNIISWLFSKSLWFSLSGRLFPQLFLVDSFSSLRSLLWEDSQTTLSEVSSILFPTQQMVILFSHHVVNFFYFSFSLFVYYMVPSRDGRYPEVRDFVFFVHPCILKRQVTLAKCMSH